MWCYSIIIFILLHSITVESACVVPKKYYIDCGTTRTLSAAVQLCIRYGMVLVNLTNSSSISSDISILNQTLKAANCSSNFWFASGNKTGYVGNVDSLDEILAGVLGGVLGLVGDLVGGVLCLLGGLLGGSCPTTTTAAPITQAMTLCVRSIQPRVIQKCLTSSAQSNMRTFKFTEQQIYGGVLDTFSARSLATCSGLCSSDNECIGISYVNGICKLIM